mmetsp:Transcript_51742/g.110647  ORF Transcript_51742/g.110647 Transcript_51742/m.110647 type:complete len:263 (+) Transcript_51742:1035-1823(+)
MPSLVVRQQAPKLVHLENVVIIGIVPSDDLRHVDLAAVELLPQLQPRTANLPLPRWRRPCHGFAAFIALLRCLGNGGGRGSQAWRSCTAAAQLSCLRLCTVTGRDLLRRQAATAAAAAAGRTATTANFAAFTLAATPFLGVTGAHRASLCAIRALLRGQCHRPCWRRRPATAAATATAGTALAAASRAAITEAWRFPEALLEVMDGRGGQRPRALVPSRVLAAIPVVGIETLGPGRQRVILLPVFTLYCGVHPTGWDLRCLC